VVTPTVPWLMVTNERNNVKSTSTEIMIVPIGINYGLILLKIMNNSLL